MVDALRRLAIPDQRVDLYWIAKLYHLMPLPDHWVVRQKDLDTKDYMYMKKNLFSVPPCFLYLYQISRDLASHEMLMVQFGNGEADKTKHVYGSNWHIYKDNYGKVHRVNLWTVFKQVDSGEKFYREPPRLSRPVGKEWYPDTQTQVKAKKIHREIHTSIDHDRVASLGGDQSTSTPTRSPRNKTTENKMRKLTLISPTYQGNTGLGAYYQSLRNTTDQWRKTKANIDSQITHKIEFSTINSRAHMRGYGFNLNPITRASIKKKQELALAKQEKSEASPRNSARAPTAGAARSHANLGISNLHHTLGSTLGSGRGFLRASVSAASHNFRSRSRIPELSGADNKGATEMEDGEPVKAADGAGAPPVPEQQAKRNAKIGFYVNRAEEFTKVQGPAGTNANEDDPFEQFERQQLEGTDPVGPDLGETPEDDVNRSINQNPEDPPNPANTAQARLKLISMKDKLHQTAGDTHSEGQHNQDAITLPDEGRMGDLQQTVSHMNKTAGTFGGTATRTQTAGYRTSTGLGMRGTNYNSFTRAKRLTTADPTSGQHMPTLQNEDGIAPKVMGRSSAGMFYQRLAEETQSIWSHKMKSAQSKNLFSPYEPDGATLQRVNPNSTLTNYNKARLGRDTSNTASVRVSVQESVKEVQEVTLLKRKLASSAPSISMQSLRLALVTPDTTMYQDISQMPIPLGGSRLMSGEVADPKAKPKKPAIKEKTSSSRR